jgi:ketosteroid isomerase-like protein
MLDADSAEDRLGEMRVTDKEDIREMIARWSQTDADKDIEGFVALFTENGVYRGRRGASEGREAIRKNITDRITLNPPDRKTMHLFCEGIIDVDGDRATAVFPYVGYGRIGGSRWEVMTIGRYHCELLRTAEGWRFNNIENRSIGEPGWPATVLHHPSV